MFQFRRFPSYAYLIQRTMTRYCRAGFPHSEISGSKRMCRSPKLIAACHVLHRLLMPRHSPCALISLTYFLLVFAIAVLELCRLHIRLFFEIVIVLPLNLKVPQFLVSLFASLLPCFLHTLFVQFSRCKKKIHCCVPSKLNIVRSADVLAITRRSGKY